MRLRLIWGVFAALVIAGLLTWAARDHEGGNAVRVGGGTMARTRPCTAIDLILPGDLTERIDAQRPAHGDGQRVARILSVVDGQLGSPLSFSAKTETEGVQLELQSRGRILVSADLRTWRSGIDLDVHSPGYSESRTIVSEDSPTTIGLVPTLQTTIRVVRNGSTVHIDRTLLGFVRDGIECSLKGSVVTRREDGVIAITHAQELVVHLYERKDLLAFSALVSPGSNLVVNLDDPLLLVRLVDRGGRPVAGVLLQPLGNSEKGQQDSQLISDVNGIVAIAASKGKMVVLQVASNRVRLAAQTRQGPGVIVRKRVLEISPEALLSGGGLVAIEVDPCVARIRFVDQETRSPITGVAYFIQRVVLAGQKPIDAVQYNAQLNDGWMEFPAGFSEASSAPAHGQSLMSAAGYEPFVLPEHAYPFLQ